MKGREFKVPLDCINAHDHLQMLLSVLQHAECGEEVKIVVRDDYYHVFFEFEKKFTVEEGYDAIQGSESQ